MNRLKGKIELINSHDELLLIELNVQETKMKAIIIGKPNGYSYLEIGNETAILFKETEVTISINKHLYISNQNKLTCTVDSIKKGQLLSQVNLNFHGVTLSSIITTTCVENLNLNPLDTVTALIKINEITLSEC
ncbi:TOBE domain-containing protein [Flavobacteriales bacterium]|nr:TOBE domain-containing protein [Flavobacteriales bacterium]